ncbi:hypothetical protein B9Z55_015044 [Caenorhabditis nigoni]|uniref:SUN domain-containing protein n=1 Tax=Caenorhabditis nigoni TaxID=1611254 RepID=A0A2G5U8D6_9PELO|nr:hypothetical protein B9Z55_015044 [Caenorhabditis nigoni]
MIPMQNYGLDARQVTDIEQPRSKTKIWYHWFNIRFRQYLILEIFLVISLIMIHSRLQAISNQNDRVLEIVNSMQSQFEHMERKIESLVSRKPKQDINQSDNTKPLEHSIADVLKNMKFPTQKSVDNKEQITIPQINQSISKTEDSLLKVPVSNELFRFNAADYLEGASVDMDYSSSSNLNPIIGYDQTNLVLLDRPQPPADKAWCTNDANPVLTINLAKYIKPISVSYQHSKWYGTIPNGVPKTYDVVACLEFYCEKWEPLASNCKYSQYKTNEKEQMCNISSHLDVPSIGKVQFRFRENYGDTKTTCVHLVRVYGETETPVKIKEKKVESQKLCADLGWYYHNSYFKYTWTDKNCSVLYENQCCSDCPECCQECLISDYNKYTFADIFLYLCATIMASLLIVGICCVIFMPEVVCNSVSLVGSGKAHTVIVAQ